MTRTSARAASGSRPARRRRFSGGRGLSKGVSNVMVPQTLKYGVVLACGVLALASLSASADDQKGNKPALSGTWGKKDGELKIEFADKDVMKIAPHGDSAVIAIV